MKLICDKCEKKISNYNIRHSCDEEGIYLTIIKGFCHNEEFRRGFHSFFNVFLPSDYGDIHFFKKDEPKKTAKFRRYEPTEIHETTEVEKEW